METLAVLLNGFIVILQPKIFACLISGFLLGAFFGAVPGLTATLAIALLLPITYSMNVVSALVMCMGIFMAGIYSGSITATTINIPGAPSAMMTATEGYPLMKRGEGAKALGHAAFGSMVGGTVGALFLMLVAPMSAKLALLVRTPGKFSLILFALVVIVVAQKKNILKGALATFLGIMLATIGIDILSPVPRFTFGFSSLVGGIDIMPLIIGTFAISELLIQAEGDELKMEVVGDGTIRRSDFVPKLEELKEVGLLTYIKSTLIGFWIGILPGAGGSMAAFVSYAEAMRASKNPEKFGNGSIEGIAAAETANNAMCGGALVPMLTFGIPGDCTSAVVLGVLIINGLKPGPQLLTTQFHLIAPMFAALFVSALFLIPITLFLLGPYYMKIVSINRSVLYTSIALVALVGGYVSTNSIFQMGATLFLGVMAYFLRKSDFSTVPLLLGAILGPMLEKYFRRAMMISDGNPLIFLTSPDSLFFIVLTVIFVYFFLCKLKPGKETVCG